MIVGFFRGIFRRRGEPVPMAVNQMSPAWPALGSAGGGDTIFGQGRACTYGGHPDVPSRACARLCRSGGHNFWPGASQYLWRSTRCPQQRLR